jgi:hypothetical protein
MPCTRLAFVLTREPCPPTPAAVLEAWAAVAPDGPALAPELVRDGAPVDPQATPVASFVVGGRDVLHVGVMPAAVPDGEADDAARFSVGALGTGWTLAEHRAHLVVVLQEQGVRPPFEGMTLFTRLVAAVTRASDAVAVYWGDAGATHDARFFVEVASDGALPVLLWTGVSAAVDEDDRLSLLSLGLRQLGLPDLHLTAPREIGNDALPFFFDLIAYAARKGAAVPAGDTVGRNPGERLRVRHEPSPLDPDDTVWRVDLPG